MVTLRELARLNTVFWFQNLAIVSTHYQNESVLHLSKANSKAIPNQPKDEQEIEVRAGVEPQNHLTDISTNVYFGGSFVLFHLNGNFLHPFNDDTFSSSSKANMNQICFFSNLVTLT